MSFDNFVKKNSIKSVDILKIDTQGYDIFVIKGAREALEKKMIKCIYVEVNFVSLYEGQGNCFDLWSYLMSCGYDLVDFYDKGRAYKDEEVEETTMCWANALFMNRRPL